MNKAKSFDTVSTGKVTIESWDSLFQYWHERNNDLDWNCIFMLPPWLKTWWESFGSTLKPYICAVWYQSEIIGIAPFIIDGDTVRLMGSSEVTDHVDFIIAHRQGPLFFSILCSHLRQEGITLMDTGQMRGDSLLIEGLRTIDNSIEYEIHCKRAGRIYELDLPRTWDEYLSMLSGKERHEIRRKLRRLYEAGRITHRIMKKRDEIVGSMDIFITLFRSNSPEKARFMNRHMESFFRSLTDQLAEYGFVTLSFLEINGVPEAATLCFDYRSDSYIYNNGYDTKYRSLSVGLLSKIFSIRDSIQHGRNRYDFLKGNETYKGRLGGLPVQLQHCWVKLK